MRITRKQLRRLVKEEITHVRKVIMEQSPIGKESPTISTADKLLKKVLAGKMTATQALGELTQDERDPGVWGVDPAVTKLEDMASAETMSLEPHPEDKGPDIAHLVKPQGPGWSDLTLAGQERILKLHSTQAASRSDLNREEIKDLQSAMLYAAGFPPGSREAQRALGCRSRSAKYCPDGSFGRKSVKLWNLLSTEKVSSVDDINDMHRADTLGAAVGALGGDKGSLKTKFTRSRSRPEAGPESYDPSGKAVSKAAYTLYETLTGDLYADDFNLTKLAKWANFLQAGRGNYPWDQPEYLQLWRIANSFKKLGADYETATDRNNKLRVLSLIGDELALLDDLIEWNIPMLTKHWRYHAETMESALKPGDADYDDKEWPAGLRITDGGEIEIWVQDTWFTWENWIGDFNIQAEIDQLRRRVADARNALRKGKVS